MVERGEQMSGHEHFIKKCNKCDTVIAQCRCIDKNKTVKLGMCEKCKAKLQPHVINCIIEMKEEDELLFFVNAKRNQADAFLDGYAIIPVEEYKRLKEKIGEEIE